MNFFNKFIFALVILAISMVTIEAGNQISKIGDVKVSLQTKHK